ncbi:MAG: hypothetical protein NTU83_11515 [Candidatus Hydrogenedentes bacterium]|nr:hypothetical protein [Candidatus Hydrogenedentota bacterium]
MSFYSWRPYVSVAQRRANARKEMERLRKKGKNIQPVELDGRKIASSFWGKGWCEHLESFSDFENRLPRGRTYVRNGSVCHLDVQTGRIEAFVSGSELYKVSIEIKPLVRKTWGAIKTKCQGKIGSVRELLHGRLSSCPDWATMCKHVAAVLYGVGSRLDRRPDLLFVLRGVDAEELISAEMALPTGAAVSATEALAESRLGEIFGVDIETGDAPRPHKASKIKAAQPGARSKNGQAAPEQEARRPSVSELPKKRAAKSAKSAKTKSKKPKAAKTRPPVFDPRAPTGAAIVHLRKQAGLSVADFADSLGVSVPSVRWENTPGPLRLYARPLAALTRMQEGSSSK